ncbi:MAG TPA: hypothetical protein VK111_07230 [Virgibacillus sp.]|nr:hypothetical protein [Virgibacillus sp.]
MGKQRRPIGRGEPERLNIGKDRDKYRKEKGKEKEQGKKEKGNTKICRYFPPSLIMNRLIKLSDQVSGAYHLIMKGGCGNIDIHPCAIPEKNICFIITLLVFFYMIISNPYTFQAFR